MRKRYSFTLIELLSSMCVIFILIGTFAVYANATLKVGRETALRAELTNIRMSLQHYRIINGYLPQDLSELLKNNLTAVSQANIMTTNKFLKNSRTDKEGRLLDPFFNRYGYNKVSGKVYSQTRGYERW